MFKKILNLGVIFCFSLSTAVSLPLAHADSILNLPIPGILLSTSSSFTPALIKGLKIDPKNSLGFNFIVDTGDSNLTGDALKQESNRMIKYFLAALTVPEKDLWVNLSPYEKGRIVPQGFGQTEMGRDMLGQDYILKQLTASLIYPESQLGKTFWAKVYRQAQEQFGTTNIPFNTFNKVWIVPEHAVIYEHDGTAFVIENKLKVMLEEDYLSLQKHVSNNTHTLGSQVIREVLIPAIEKEVNEGKNFATLRQIANATVLAAWYKQALKESLLGKIYANKNKINGVDVQDKTVKLKIYNQYLQAFKKGVYNYIKEDFDPLTNQTVPRKYFSGGTVLDYSRAMTVEDQAQLTEPQRETFLEQTTPKHVFNVYVLASGISVASHVGITWEPIQNVPSSFGSVMKQFGLLRTNVQAVRLKGNLPVEEVLSNPGTRFAVDASIGQAFGSAPFAGVKDEEDKLGKIADGNAVYLGHLNMLAFVKENPNEVRAIMVAEGAQDGSASSKMFRIYSSEYKNNGYYYDPKDSTDFEETISNLRAQGKNIEYITEDALEKTKGLSDPDARTQNTGSWSLVGTHDDSTEIRKGITPLLRKTGISFSAPNDAGVDPFDLPSVAIEKIAKANGYVFGTPAYDDYVNSLDIMTLGPRTTGSGGKKGSDTRHQLIIDDAHALQAKYKGIQVVLRGDGDLNSRLIASTGLNLDGRRMIVFGRSGAAEATAAEIGASLVANGQFVDTFTSTQSTNESVTKELAHAYTEDEERMFKELNYPPHASTAIRKSSDIRGKGIVAMTAVTGPTEGGPIFADLLQRVTFNVQDNTATTNTFLIIPDGSVFVVRTTFKSDNILVSQRALTTATPKAAVYVATHPQDFDLAQNTTIMPVKQHIRTHEQDLGGINLDPAMYNIQIKRDGKGIPLPVDQQPIDRINISGIRAVIKSVTPADLPLMLGVAQTSHTLAMHH